MIRKPFTVAMVVPTGIGCRIGGHAGDATLSARLLGAVCDNLIVHPNVVNAADLNEMPANALYVEGSTLDRFLEGYIFLIPTRANRVLVVSNGPRAEASTINCMNAARTLLGMQIELMVLDTPLVMRSIIADGVARGTVKGIEELILQVAAARPYDAIAIHTPIKVNRRKANKYLLTGEGVNLWGGVEAIVSRKVAESLGCPVAHAPVETNAAFNEVVAHALAAELISGSMLFSVLKGLWKAPRISRAGGHRDGLIATDVDALVTADCWGPPHIACLTNNIPIIMVENNTTNRRSAAGRFTWVARSYREAAGALVAIREGMRL